MRNFIHSLLADMELERLQLVLCNGIYIPLCNFEIDMENPFLRSVLYSPKSNVQGFCRKNR